MVKNIAIDIMHPIVITGNTILKRADVQSLRISKFLTIIIIIQNYSTLAGFGKLLHSPADKFIFAKAQIETHLSGADCMSALATSFQIVTANTIEAPRAFTRSHAEARFLGVDCEHRNVKFLKSACGQKNYVSFPYTISNSYTAAPLKIMFRLNYIACEIAK